ncbi:nitrilase-related carbon-nitrogen hydrolase [Leifsonia sp. F6_8S_P_1B]|uniref:Nitrilase-related carbon-nitrogen hydrolase n=1 Tax=Leifsonia williamsii TaxID=3035919 RepID=A0ABT8K8R8_9MICO|nr:nitrilase-related carbon-nitrogen hydrolase [Leifsonia williamsii]MDN4613853.1 nitrilase-related carbon-nitrogen hydrolase [Leifsonia williamsii]
MTTVTALQLAPVVGDLAGNRERAAAAIADAFSSGASIVVVPELATSGYVFRDREEARSVSVRPDHELFAEWASLARSARDGLGVVVGGFSELGDDGAVYNSAAVVDGSGVRAVYRKVHLWDREKEVFTPGDAAPPVVETPHGRVGVMICYDLEFPEWTRLAALAGADLLAVPTNWPQTEHPGERPAEQRIAVAAALVNRMPIAFADRYGHERGVEWTEGTAIVSPAGVIVSESGPGAGRATADLDLLASRDKRLSDLAHLFEDRRPDLYGGIAQ